MNATLGRILVPTVRLTRATRGYGGHSHVKIPTMDDMAKPKGNFQEEYKKRQAKYNMVLGGSFLFLVGSFFTIKSLGLFKGLGKPKIGN